MFKLIPLNEEYLKLILQWRNMKHIRECMIDDKVITWDNHIKWFRNLKERNDRKVLIFFIDDKPVGVISFVDIDMVNHNCHWGFYVGDQNAPAGTGTMMAYYALSYAFDEYKLHKVNSEVIEFNTKSINYHKSLGFIENGILPEELLRKDRYADLTLFTLFARTWNEIKDDIYHKGIKKIKGCV